MHISHMGVKAGPATPHKGTTELGRLEYLVQEDSRVGGQTSDLPVSLSSVVPIAHENSGINRQPPHTTDPHHELQVFTDRYPIIEGTDLVESRAAKQTRRS